MTPGERRDRQRCTGVRMHLLRQKTAWQLVTHGPVDDLARRLQVGRRSRLGDLPLSEPESADKPGIARRDLQISLNLEVVVVLVARLPARRTAVGQPVAYRLHRRYDSIVLRPAHSETPDAVESPVQDG